MSKLSCTECPARFYRVDALQRHLGREHGMLRSSWELRVPPKLFFDLTHKAKDQVRCPKCGRWGEKADFKTFIYHKFKAVRVDNFTGPGSLGHILVTADGCSIGRRRHEPDIREAT